MICLGFDDAAKRERLEHYRSEHAITKMVLLSPAKFRLEYDADWIDYPEIVMYRTYYRLLREIDKRTLVVVNECLRTQNRSDLTYNCIRNFLNQTEHQLVFQYLPFIESVDDFMILFDFDTRSRWKREKWRDPFRGEITIDIRRTAPELLPIAVSTDRQLRSAYQAKKRQLIDNIGLKDPHTIPRNLYLMSGKARLPSVGTGWHVGRNNRFNLECFQTYRDEAFPEHCTVFEFPHNFIDFSDFLALSRQTQVPALVADLNVDRWYFDRYSRWAARLNDAYATLLG